MIRPFDVTLIGSALAIFAVALLGPRQAAPQPAAADEVAILAQADDALRRPDAPPRAGTPGMTPELIEQCLVVAAEVDPQLATRLHEIRRKSPGPAFERAIRNARHLVGLARLKERDPQLYDVKVTVLQLDAKVALLAEQLRQTRRDGSAAAPALEAQLKTLVRQQVGLSIAARGMYLRRLRDNMKSLQDQLAEDSANFEQAVERRMETLIEG